MRIPQLIAMKIVANEDVLTTQPDFEEMSGFHEHSRERWQRKSETPKECLLENTILKYLCILININKKGVFGDYKRITGKE